MRSAEEIAEEFINGVAMGRLNCSVDHLSKVIRAAQREAIEAAAKAITKDGGCLNVGDVRMDTARHFAKVVRALLPSPTGPGDQR